MDIEIKNFPPEPSKKWAPLALGFRPFFLLGIWFAVLLMAVSLGGFATGIWHYNYFDLSLWHAHEMVFGYAAAVIAGFLLTATGNWTGLPTPSGKSLAFLTLLWLAPRLLSSVPLVPGAAFALLDMLFLPALAFVIGRLILKAKQPHNYPIPLLLMGMAFCNAVVHLDVLGFVEQVASQAMQIAVCLTLALIVVIAGRVVPFFMHKAIGRRPAAHAWIEKLALPSVLLVGLALGIDIDGFIIVTTVIAALIHGMRLISWFDRAILGQPMLWVLHAGYCWLVAGFLLYALSLFLNISSAQAVHAWTVGAIGMFTLGMMARVALGHSGRAIEALAWIPSAFVLIAFSTLCRVVLPIINPDWLDAAIYSSAMGWMIAFMIVGIRYSAMLLRARVDGKEG